MRVRLRVRSSHHFAFAQINQNRVPAAAGNRQRSEAERELNYGFLIFDTLTPICHRSRKARMPVVLRRGTALRASRSSWSLGITFDQLFVPWPLRRGNSGFRLHRIRGANVLGHRHTQTMSVARFRCNDCGGWVGNERPSMIRTRRRRLCRAFDAQNEGAPVLSFGSWNRKQQLKQWRGFSVRSGNGRQSAI